MSHFLKSRLLKPSVLIGGCIVLSKVLAGGAEAPVGLPTPGVSLYGLAGNGWLGAGDVLAPVFGQANGFAYVDPQFYYHSNNGYTGSLGAGYRQLNENTGILGAYVFGDYIRSTNDHNFWFVSPGVERLGQILDFSANAYIPVSSQRINTGTEFADQVGDFSQIVFTGHDQFDGLVNTFTSVGYGGDAQIGVHLPFFRNSEVFFGGYYFAPKDTDSVGGGAVRLQVPVNRYLSVIASEAYDSEYHNTVKAGLTLWFGGRSTGYGFTGNLAERLVDPIQRDLVLVAGGSATGVPAVSDFENTGQTALELSNISFFVPGSAPSDTSGAVQGNGTYENPYVGMSQDNVDNANTLNNRNFYIDSGTYHPTYDGMNDYIVLNNDQLYGRQDHFKQTAQGPLRPLMLFTDGGFEIPTTDVNDSINGLQLTGMNANGNAGIWIDHENSPLNQIVSLNNLSVQAFGDGIDILNSGSAGTLTVRVNNAWITQNNGDGELLTPVGVTGGISAFNDENSSLQLTVTHTIITDNSKAFSSETLQAAGGLAVANLGKMSLGVYFSNFSGNSFSFDAAIADAAGGLAIAQPSDSGQSTMSVNVRNSNLSNNSVSLDNVSVVGATGGMAITQVISSSDQNTMNVNVCNSNLSNNSASLDNVSTVDATGGLAIKQSSLGLPPESAVGESTMSVDVSGSNLSGNLASLNNGSSSAAGGLTIFQFNPGVGTTTMDVDVRNSNLSNNNSALNNSSSVIAAGGLAIFQSSQTDGTATMNVDVRNSNLSNNSSALINSSSVVAAGGLAIDQSSQTDGTATMNVDVRGSNLSNNSVSNNGGTVNVAGGLAAFGNNASQSTNIDITKSIITFNSDSDSGIAVSGPNILVSVDRSIIAWNTLSGLSAANNGEIDVGSQMLFFNGLVRVSGGTVTFPAPVGSVADNTQVVCVLGNCNIP